MATGATEFIDNTTADNSIPELWSKKLIIAREQKLVFADLVTTDYKEAVSFGDTIHVGSRTHLSTRSKSANSAITYETQTESNVDIVINVDEYAAIAVENITDLQSMLNLIETYSPEMAYALALAVDDVLAGLVDDFSTNVVGALGVDNSYAEWLEARQKLDDANVPDDDRNIVISPKAEAGMLQLDHFINRDYTEGNSTGKGSGGKKAWIGTWMGMPVYKSTNVEGSNAAGHDNTMLHKAALALVMQQSPKTFTMFDIDYLARKVASEQIYGTKEMRDDHGVWVKGA